MEYDVIVVGAGVAGCGAALTAVRAGLRVALFEAGTVPRHKVCGEFLSCEIQDVFNRLDLLAAVQGAGALPITAARIVTRHVDSGAIPFSRSGLALSRYRLDDLLWRAAAKAGVDCRDRSSVRSIEAWEAKTALGHTVRTSTDERQAKHVIAATGRNSNLIASLVKPDKRVCRYVGFKTHLQGVRMRAGEVELHPFHGGYCGLVLVEDGSANVALLARYGVLHGRSPDAFWEHLLITLPRLRERVQFSTASMPWLATANLNFGSLTPRQGDILCCGDSAAHIHPLTGDGMAMAARSGELAAQAVIAALQHGAEPHHCAQVYETAWMREFTPRLQCGALLHPFLTSNVLAPPAAALLRISPALRRMVVKSTRGESP